MPNGLRRALVVEDDEGIRELLKTALTRRSYEVEVLASGLGVLSSMTRFSPDVVILDVMTPGLSGESVLELLNKRPEHSAIPVIIYSAMPRAQLDALVLKHPRAVAVQKGSLGVLLEAVNSAINARAAVV